MEWIHKSFVHKKERISQSTKEKKYAQSTLQEKSERKKIPADRKLSDYKTNHIYTYFHCKPKYTQFVSLSRSLSLFISYW